MNLDGFEGVTTAGGRVPTTRRQGRGDEALIERDRRQEYASRERCHHADPPSPVTFGDRVTLDACAVERPCTFRTICGPTTESRERGCVAFLIAATKPDRRSEASSTLVAVAADGSALTTNAVPLGSEPNSSRTKGRRRRVT